MHRFLAVIAVLVFCGMSSSVPAQVSKNLGPETMNFKMGVVLLPFSHWKHQKLLNNDCLHCHDRSEGKITGWGEQTAHKICIPCHDLEEKGPVECHQCHDKSVRPTKK